MNVQPDNPLVKWLLGYLLAGGVLLIIAFGVGGDALAERIVSFMLPVGAVLFVLVQGGKIEAKADDNSAKLDKIETAVNGGLEVRIKEAVKRALDEKGLG